MVGQGVEVVVFLNGFGSVCVLCALVQHRYDSPNFVCGRVGACATPPKTIASHMNMGCPECICDQEALAVVRELQDIVDEHKLGMSGMAHLELSNFSMRLHQMLTEPPLDAYYEHRDVEDDADSFDGDVERLEWAPDVLSDDELQEDDDFRLRMPSPAERKLVDALFSVDRRTYTSVGARRYLQAELSRHLEVSSANVSERYRPTARRTEVLRRRQNSVRACYNEAALKFHDILRVVYDNAKILVMEERSFRHLRRDAEEERRVGGEARLKTFWLDRTYVERTSADNPEFTIPATRSEAIQLQRVGGFHHRAPASPALTDREVGGNRPVVVEGELLTTHFLVVTPALVDLAKRVHRGAMQRVSVG